MTCITCLTRESLKYDECDFCFKMKSGMSTDDFKTLCRRIASYSQLKRLVPTQAVDLIQAYPRPISHPFCKRQGDAKTCVAEAPTWSAFKLRRDQIGGTLPQNTWKELCAQDCEYCGIKPSNGIDRMDSQKGYTLGNSVAACKQCNSMKYTFRKNEFVNHANVVARL